MGKKIIVTGGAGFIGSTIASALIDVGHTPIIMDSLITGRVEFTRGRIFYKADIADAAALEQIFRDHPDIQAAVHCAALIIVPESTEQPYLYYRENVGKSVELFDGHRFDLVLSGHTHGGQIAVPFFARDYNLSKLSHHHHLGVYRRDKSTLYVHPGLGTTGPPIRLGVAPGQPVAGGHPFHGEEPEPLPGGRERAGARRVVLGRRRL